MEVRRSARIAEREERFSLDIDDAIANMLDASMSTTLTAEAPLARHILTSIRAAAEIDRNMAFLDRAVDRAPAALGWMLKRPGPYRTCVKSCAKLSQSMKRVVAPTIKLARAVGSYRAAPVEKPAECCVCGDADQVARSGEIVLRGCGGKKARHALCVECFLGWFIEASESTCPLCRHDYGKNIERVRF